MGMNGSLHASGLPDRTSSPTAQAAPGVTCVVIADGGLRLVAMADGPAAGADAREDLDLARIAELLEHAASRLRGEDLTTGPARANQAAGTRGMPAGPERLRVGQLEIHPESRLVLRAGQPVPLSRIEFDLFLALVRRRGAAATRLELVREVWGYGAAVTSRSVDTQIYNLRHKLEENPATPRYLLTVSGVGYRVMP